MGQSRLAVILSGGSRSGQQSAHLVCQKLADRAEFIELSSRPSDQHNAIQKALKVGIKNIWVGGGDGSIRAAASQLANTSAVLSILPLGTGNSLARELGIPIDTEQAIEFHLNEAVVRKIDVGTINRDYFVNVATLGFTTKIMEQVQESNKSMFGRLVYLPSVIKAYSAARSFDITVETDEEIFEGRALQFVAASTRLHGGPFPVSENSAIDDGKLSIYVLEDKSRASLLKYCLALAVGKQTQLPEVWNVESTKAIVTLKSAKKFVVDGDPLKTAKAEILIQAGALLVSARSVEIRE